MKRGPRIGAGFDNDAAAQAFDLFTDNRKPESMTRNIGDDGAGGHTGLKRQCRRLRFTELFRFFGGDEAEFAGCSFNHGEINACSIIGHKYLGHTAVLWRAGKRYCSLGRLALAYAHPGLLDTVINAVTHKVDKRIFHLLQDVPVNLELAPPNYQFQAL